MNTTAPSDAELESALGGRVERRTTLRSTPLATIERVELALPSGTRSAIVKTVIPELRHELAANRLAADAELCAAPLEAYGEADGGIWMVLPDVESDSDWQLSTELLPGLMQRLAEFHATNWTPDHLAPFKDRSPTWFVANAAVVETALWRLGERVGASISNDEVAAYLEALDQLAYTTQELPKTLVHGDFDPGNVALVRGEPRALDWGLTHLNLPTADVAHMLLNFGPSDRQPAFEAYRDAYTTMTGDAGWLGDAAEGIRLGDLAHKAFFVWWHSTAVLDHGMDTTLLVPIIRQRIRTIVEWVS